MLAVSLARTFVPASRLAGAATVGPEIAKWQAMCDQLIASVCNL